MVTLAIIWLWRYQWKRIEEFLRSYVEDLATLNLFSSTHSHCRDAKAHNKTGLMLSIKPCYLLIPAPFHINVPFVENKQAFQNSYIWHHFCRHITSYSFLFILFKITILNNIQCLDVNINVYHINIERYLYSFKPPRQWFCQCNSL
jgi:hypothetical protein